MIKQGTSMDDFRKFYYKTFEKSYPALLSAATVVQLIIYHLLTESEVIAGKSQTEALMY